MRMSLNWLSELVDIKGLSEEEIINKIVKAGFEVEEVIHLGQGDNLCVGKIIACIDHPDSDHLHVTKVDIGNTILNIVCGAPNCRTGLKVIVAKVGAKLPGGEIKRSNIRGIESNGMLCSLYELGIPKDLLPANSTSFNGIEELDDSFKVGEEDILEKLNLKDTILDLSIYANRPDCLAMFPLAKEMGAILDREVHLPSFEGAGSIGENSSLKVISNTPKCPHYMAKVVKHITLKPSPLWMSRKLLSAGIKSINNVVDISNLVMLETGQPLHFFDLRSNPNLNITINDDYSGKYVALDGNAYQIEKGDIMIESDNKPIAIAGIMGGDGSKILDDTTGIIIESALFDRSLIRHTANRLGLMTEAASRYAKGLDPLAQNKAMDRAIELLIKYADASGIENTVEAGKADYVPHVIEETLSHLNKLIGKAYSMEEVVDVLKRLDFKPEVKGDAFICHIPSYRSDDLKIREDIDEEIIRLSGFDDLKASLPKLESTAGKLSKRQNLRRIIRETFADLGLQETISYTLEDAASLDNGVMKIGEAISLLSPLSDNRKYLRTSLFPSLFEILSYNNAHGLSDINIFEISSLYSKEKTGEHLGIMLYGHFINEHFGNNNNADYYDLKALLQMLLNKLGYNSKRIKIKANEENQIFHPYRSAKLYLDKELLAIFGELHPALLRKEKLNRAVYAEIDLEILNNIKPAAVKAQDIPKYPGVSRDISLLIDKNINAQDVIDIVKHAGGNLIKSVKVFDIYEGIGIPEDKKSLALSIFYQDNNKTLTNDEISALHGKVLDTLNKHFKAILR